MSHRTLKAGFCRWALVLSVAILVVGFLCVRFAGTHIFVEAHAQTSNSGTRLLRTPTVSATQIAFAYAQHIWVVHASSPSSFPSRRTWLVCRRATP